MPFVPLSPEEKKRDDENKCTDKEHSGPFQNMVVRKTMKWVCPSCGKMTVVSPSIRS